MKNELKSLKTIKSKYYNLEQENEKNKKTIENLHKELNVLNTLNSGYINNNNKIEINEDEKLELENLRLQNNELKNNLFECDNKLKKTEEKLLKMQQQLNEQINKEQKEINKKNSNKLNPIKNSVIFFNDKDDMNKDNDNKDKDNNDDNYNLGESELVFDSNDNNSEKNNVNNNNNNMNTEQMIKNYKFVQDENKALQELVKDLKAQIKQMKSNKTNGTNNNNDIEKLNNIIHEKDSKIYNLEEQIKEYQKKCDDIIIGKSNEDKDKQIEILINEINSMRKKILNDVSYNNRITNFDDFIKDVEKINELNSEIIDPDIQDAFVRLNDLIEIYKQNNENIISKLKNNDDEE